MSKKESTMSLTRLTEEFTLNRTSHSTEVSKMKKILLWMVAPLICACILSLTAPAQTAAHAVDADGHQWWQDAVFYEIYPRSFADSNNDGVAI